MVLFFIFSIKKIRKADAKGFEPSISSVTGRRVNRATPRVRTADLIA